MTGILGKGKLAERTIAEVHAFWNFRDARIVQRLRVWL